MCPTLMTRAFRQICFPLPRFGGFQESGEVFIQEFWGVQHIEVLGATAGKGQLTGVKCLQQKQATRL
jgi:hypothetical protein